MEILKNNLNKINTNNGLITSTPKLRMKDRIGFLPTSIWEPDWKLVKALKKFIGDTGSTRAWDKNSKNFRGVGIYGTKISIFNPHLSQMILAAYCPLNAKIYDPFAGGGTRAIIASAMEHTYFGIELRKEEVDRLAQVKEYLGFTFEIVCGDSTNYINKRNYYDFSYTCPPYFNLEVYSKLENDVSNSKSYTDFLLLIHKAMEGVFKALKKNCLSVWVVGNFRDVKGTLIYFNGDLVRIALAVGFVLHDDIIFKGASLSAVQRCGNFEANRKSVRVHEHVLIFRKL